MARALTPTMVAEIQQGLVQPVLIADITCASGSVRVWSGIGDLVFNANIYQGVGNLGGVSAIRETSNTEATGVNFNLSGIPGGLISTALGDIRYGLPAKLYFGLLNGSGNLIADPYLIFSGLTDNAIIDEGPDTSAISIVAEGRFIDLDRPRARRYTPEDQAIDYPNDRGFEFVASLQEAVVLFGGG